MWVWDPYILSQIYFNQYISEGISKELSMRLSFHISEGISRVMSMSMSCYTSEVILGGTFVIYIRRAFMGTNFHTCEKIWGPNRWKEFLHLWGKCIAISVEMNTDEMFKEILMKMSFDMSEIQFHVTYMTLTRHKSIVPFGADSSSPLT